MNKKIALYLISGFLGSGKTTFLKQLLEQSNTKRVGVIVNEFGSVGIDGKVLHNKDLKMVEINNGSIFCACLKGGFVKTLVAFLEQPIDVLFIEASGMADPSSMKNLLQQLDIILDKKPQINRKYEYKGSICLVDASRFMEFSEIFLPTENQVKKSSLLIVKKLDEVLEEDVEELHSKLVELNNKAYIYNTTFGKVPLELIDSKVKPEGMIDEETTNTIFNRPATYIIEMVDVYDLEKMREFSLAMSENVLRCKGFFKTIDEKIVHSDCVGDYLKFNVLENNEIEMINTFEIVLIGKNNHEYKEKLVKCWNKYFPGQKLFCERA